MSFYADLLKLCLKMDIENIFKEHISYNISRNYKF